MLRVINFAFVIVTTTTALSGCAPDYLHDHAVNDYFDAIGLEKELETLDEFKDGLDNRSVISGFADSTGLICSNAAVRAEVSDAVSNFRFAALKPAFLSIYAKIFTAEELKAMGTFYRTPVGRKLLHHRLSSLSRLEPIGNLNLTLLKGVLSPDENTSLEAYVGSPIGDKEIQSYQKLRTQRFTALFVSLKRNIVIALKRHVKADGTCR